MRTTDQSRAWEERGLREAILAGDEAAWACLYHRHFDLLYTRVWFKVGRDAHRAEEVVQESWLIAVRRIRRFDPAKGAFEAWLWGITENVLRNHWRRWNKRAGREQALQEAGLEQQCATHEAPLDASEEIALCLAALRPSYRRVLEAKYAQGLSVNEIADRQQQSAKAVESLLTRARVAFRKAYAKLAEE